jgi:hypothetical protein
MLYNHPLLPLYDKLLLNLYAGISCFMQKKETVSGAVSTKGGFHPDFILMNDHYRMITRDLQFYIL